MVEVVVVVVVAVVVVVVVVVAVVVVVVVACSVHIFTCLNNPPTIHRHILYIHTQTLTRGSTTRVPPLDTDQEVGLLFHVPEQSPHHGC